MNQGTILIVDDTLASLKLLADILTEEGYRVHPADSVELALASVASSLPELILLDIRMPGMEGFEVLRKLKAQERSRDIPVILLTAFADIEHRVEGFDLGAADFISKPFQREELLARVHIHLELFRLRALFEHQATELRQAYEQLRDATSAGRKLSDEALRASEARYKRITEGLTDYQYTVRIENGRAVETMQSPACVTVTGYTAEEFSADPYLWIQMVSPDDRERVKRHVEQILEGKDVPPIEHRITRKDWQTRWVIDTTILFRDAGGKLVSYDGVIQDITGRKRAEIALGESVARYRAITESTAYAIVTANIEGNIVGWNAGAERTFGYTRAEVLGQPLTVLMPQRYHERHTGGMGRARGGGHVSSRVVELHGLSKTGTEFPLELSLSEWDITDGRFFTGIIRDISERKQAEENLQRFFNLVPDMACIASTEGHFLKINPMWQATLGYTEQEMLATPFMEFIHPDDREATRRQVSQTLADKPILMFTNRYRCKDGSYKWLEWRATPAINGKTLLFALARDTTERRAIESKLIESEARYKRITEGLTDYQYTVRIENGRAVETRQNPGCVTVTGYTAEEFAADPYLWIQMVAPDDRERVREQVQQILAGKDVPPIEHKIIRKDGETRWVSDTTILLRGASGKLLSYDGVISDITERKRVESALGQSEARYRSLVNNSPMCINEIDLEGRIASMNKAGLLMMGVKHESEVRGLSYLDAVCAADRERIGDLLARAYAGETSYFEFKTSGPSEWVFKSCFVPIWGKDGNIEKLMGITEDITERKQVEDNIRSLAFYDALTQLPNRRMLNDRIGQAMAASKRTGLYGALMFLDLDNFKPLNDTYGHEVGDLLLAEVARRLTGCVREMDTVARFGGDEFVVMFTELDTGKAESVVQAGIVAEKIRVTLAEPYLLLVRQEGQGEIAIEHHCTSSIGVVLFIDHEASPEDVLKWADMAMYQAKDGGRNRYHFYE
ncbi:MAG: PAS domain S-box protein [Nitrosomonadales bacterium]|nr:PAS domain S-box protein [Nitrosomonadales bacterium]